LSGIVGQVGGRSGIIESVNQRDGAGALADVGIFRGDIGIAAGNRMLDEMVDAAERRRGLKKIAGKGRQLAGLDRGTEAHSGRRNEQTEMRVCFDASVARLRNAGFGNKNMALRHRRLLAGANAGRHKCNDGA
jgi:hypothetical protein